MLRQLKTDDETVHVAEAVEVAVDAVEDPFFAFEFFALVVPFEVVVEGKAFADGLGKQAKLEIEDLVDDDIVAAEHHLHEEAVVVAAKERYSG